MLNKIKNANSGITSSPNITSNEGRTIIGKLVSIEGSIRGKENLVIEGSLKGTIELEENQVTIGPKGQVEGEIYADNITISGKMIGNIKARDKVEITREANFNGEIKAKRISVEDGAFIKTVIEMERRDDAQKKTTSTDKPVAKLVHGQQGKESAS